MKDHKYNIGNRVRIIRPLSDHGAEFLGIGSVGVITGLHDGQYDYIVEWENEFPFGYIMEDEQGIPITSEWHGWKVYEKDIEVIVDYDDNFEAASNDDYDLFLCS